MRVAVYGGSFNPPHVGHAMVAGWLLWTGRADEVWLLPAFDHPFQKDLARWEARLALCEALAAELGPRVRVCDVESRLPVPSYTLDTLRHLRDAHPEVALRLVLGADNLPDLPRWKRWDRIAAEFDPIVVGRQGWPVPEGTVAFPEVSSTEIRRRIAEGEPVDHLVPARVLRAMGGLYRDTRRGSGPSPTMPKAS